MQIVPPDSASVEAFILAGGKLTGFKNARYASRMSKAAVVFVAMLSLVEQVAVEGIVVWDVFVLVVACC